MEERNEVVDGFKGEVQQAFGQIEQHLNYLGNRIMHTEMALDTALGMLFDAEVITREKFAETYKEKLDKAKAASELQQKDMAEAQAPAEEVQPVEAEVVEQAKEVNEDVINVDQ